MFCGIITGREWSAECDFLDRRGAAVLHLIVNSFRKWWRGITKRDITENLSWGLSRRWNGVICHCIPLCLSCLNGTQREAMKKNNYLRSIVIRNRV